MKRAVCFSQRSQDYSTPATRCSLPNPKPMFYPSHCFSAGALRRDALMLQSGPPRQPTTIWYILAPLPFYIDDAEMVLNFVFLRHYIDGADSCFCSLKLLFQISWLRYVTSSAQLTARCTKGI